MAGREATVSASASSLMAIAVLLWACSSGVSAATTIAAFIEDPFTVHCTGLSGQTVVRDYGEWSMSSLTMNNLEFSDDPSITEIDCRFAYNLEGTDLHKDFTIFPTAATSVHCDPLSCKWTVQEDGFYFQDITTGLPTYLFMWDYGMDSPSQ